MPRRDFFSWGHMIIAILVGLTFYSMLPLNEKTVAIYENYQIYRITFDHEDQINIFRKLESSESYTFFGYVRHLNQNLTILVPSDKIPEFVDILQRYMIPHEILVSNLQKLIDQQHLDVKPINTDLSSYDWDHYFHLETILLWLKKLADDNEHVSLIQLGKSFENRNIDGIYIEFNPKNPSIFIESGIHAREWIAPATATFIINKLLSLSNGTSDLKERFNWFIVPIVNPDGYKYSFEHDRMWRKNRNIYERCRGVDLNRNFPFYWNSTGSSSNPCRFDYAGPFGESEPETKALTSFIKNNVKNKKIKVYLALHSYSQLIMFPYGHTSEKVSNYNDLTTIGRKAVNAIKKTTKKIYKSGSIYETIYPSSGGSKDWAYSVTNIPITFTFELRGPPESSNLFILPANEIRPTGEETWAAIEAILNEADNLGYFK